MSGRNGGQFTSSHTSAAYNARSAAEIWPDKPAKARQKDVDGRWTVKYSKAKVRTDGTKPIDIAIPLYGYKSHVSIDRMHGLIGHAGQHGLQHDPMAVAR